ncbi:T9SS type A sorting domain-containing protein [Flavobacterium sp.]
MKKITLLFFLIGTAYCATAQVLNQSAGWPNPAWTVTGSYATGPTAFESDPTTTPNFAFDDDDAVNGHEDNIAAESPVINLTPAFTAGETWLTVNVEYGYRYFDFDQLRLEYWNADTAAWVAWGANIPGNSTTATDNFCTTITKTTYTSTNLSIAGFTATQLSGFRYRISYDDTVGAADWNYGFCFDSPVITSSTPPSCPAPTALGAVFTSNSATLSWTENGTATLYNVEYGANGFTQGTGTLLSGVAASPVLSPLTPNTAYSYYVQASCGGVAGNSAWVGPFNFTTLFAPPTNDDCAGAISLTVNPDFACGNVTAGSTQGGTLSLAAAPCFGNPDDDVWFSFVATSASHRIVLSNIVAVGGTGTSTDAYMQVLSGTCGTQTSVLCSDPNTANATGLTVGETYYVRVYSYGNANNITFNICVGTPPPPPANDECSGAVALTVNPDYNCGSFATGTVVSATPSNTDATACLGAEDDDVWYSFVATATSHRITISNVAGSVVDMFHSTWTGADCNNLTLVPGSCSDPNSSNPSGLTIGQTYYVRVNTYTATTGQTTTFNICVGTAPAPPANDECSGAVALTVNTDLSCGTVTPGTVAGATASNTEVTTCAGGEDDDVWFSFVATNTTHTISLLNIAGSVTDMAHSLWTGADCASLQVVPGTCSDPETSTPTGLTVGQTYYVRVNSFSATGGQTTTFNICVGTPPPPPANDECAGAIALTPGGTFAINPLATTNAGATNTDGLVPSCQANVASNVWYSVVVPASGNITIETQTATGGVTDSVVVAYSGTCGGTLTAVGCNDDGGPTGPNDLMSILSLTGQTPGSTLLISVWRWSGGTGVNGAFTISAYDASLANGSFDNANFAYHPNPVKNTLNLSYNKEISNVEIFNLLGQKVNSTLVNANEAQIDMSGLAKGAYMVKVTSDNQMKTIKVIKE